MSTGTNTIQKCVHRRERSGKAVGDLLTEEKIDAYGYLPLAVGAMQAAGSAVQTVGGIRSHWGRKVYADERTIAKASCLSESTVRFRHMPKLLALKYIAYDWIESPNGKRKDWRFTVTMQNAGYKNFLTLPRWAALSLPKWSYRVVYAAVLQRTLATVRGSQKNEMALEVEDVASGNYGRHNFSLSDLEKITGLGRHTVIDAKKYLCSSQSQWLVFESSSVRGHDLLVNLEKEIPESVLGEAYQTTRRVMFPRRKGEKDATS